MQPAALHLGMPTAPFLTAGDLVKTLTKMAGVRDGDGGDEGTRASLKTFKTMTVYVVGLCTLKSFEPYPITYNLSNP
jgi:hypothetical protein